MTQEEYITLISREPTPEMIEQGEGYKYIKKTVLKQELLKIYGGHTKFEVLREVVSKNGLWGTGLFHYQHPVSGIWLFEAGAASLKIGKGMKLDFPALKTAIFKNAVKELGIFFGQTLNSEVEDAEPENAVAPVEPTDPEKERLIKLIESCSTPEELKTFELLAKSKKIMQVFNKQQKKLTK